MVRLTYEVVLVRGTITVRRKFEDLAHGQAFERAMRDRYGSGVVAFRLNDPLPPPKEWKPKKGHLWCGFCAAGRKFLHVASRDVDCCSICGISTRNWYVRAHNGLWGI